MNKLCRKKIYRSKIDLYAGSESIARQDIPISIVVCPKLLLMQRFCKTDSADFHNIKIIITVFNYEHRGFNKLCLDHCLEGVTYTYLDVVSKDKFSIKAAGLNIWLEHMPSLSARTYILDICITSGSEFISTITLKECINCSPGIIRVCKCRQSID